jgi:2-dehydro-3-deoxyphosphogalactonate aldolase
MEQPLSLAARFDAAFAALPLVAILRGIRPAETDATGAALYEAGFRLIEVPLNSPAPFDSIARLRRMLPDDALVGAGTVTHLSQIGALVSASGELVVMPHGDVALIRAAKSVGLLCTPGVATPTEAFAALAAGADALKLFPAEMLMPPVVKALRAVLPRATRLLPVGGITPESMAAYVAAGADGFGLGSALYSVGTPCNEILRRAQRFVVAWRSR